MRTYANRHGLYCTYFSCIGAQLCVFPYTGNDQEIGDEDVIYVRDGDVWRLQEDNYNAFIMSFDPVPAGSSGVSYI